MIDNMFLSLGGILLLLVLLAIVAGSETALTAAAKSRLHRLAEGGSRRARLVLDLREDPERLIGGILLTITIVSTLTTALATQFFLELLGERGIGVATVVMSVLFFRER